MLRKEWNAIVANDVRWIFARQAGGNNYNGHLQTSMHRKAVRRKLESTLGDLRAEVIWRLDAERWEDRPTV